MATPEEPRTIRLTYSRRFRRGMTAFDVKAASRAIAERIRSLGEAGPDEHLQKYLGVDRPVVGLSVPQVREVARNFSRARRGLDIGSVNAVAERVWRGAKFHEERAAAVEVLMRYRRVLDDGTWSVVDRWADDAVGWGICDAVGMGPVAALAYDNSLRWRRLVGWTRSSNPWRRRIAVYGLRDYILAGEVDRPLELLGLLLDDREVWVQRAVGTGLRECWKKDDERVSAFLRKHARGLPPVVITVATERASRAFREELRTRSREPHGGRRSSHRRSSH